MRTPRSFTILVLAGLLIACGNDKGTSDGDDKALAAEGDDKALGAKSGGIPTSREGQMYLLGQKLSQAAMVNGRAAPAVVARTFKAATTIADITLKMPLAPLPAVTGDRAKDGAAALHYLLDGQGKELAQKIAADFGDTSAATYELAVKVNMLPMLYIDTQDSMGDTLATVFGRLAARAKLPDSVLAPIITKLKARAPLKEVTNMALELNKSLPVAIAKIYERTEKK